MTEETTIYQVGNVHITNLRAVFDGKTYSVSNITSVEGKRIDPNGCLPAITIIFGIGLMLFGIADFRHNWQTILFGGIILAGGIAIQRAGRPTYAVSLTTAAGEVKAYTSPDQETIKQIISALNSAIIQKG